jgi:hypothetical protein
MLLALPATGMVASMVVRMIGDSTNTPCRQYGTVGLIGHMADERQTFLRDG